MLLSERGAAAGAGPPRATASSSRTPAWASPQDQFDRIFQSFYQVDNSSTREFGGAGLGLAIVKSFVEGHGGQVRVQQRDGPGLALHAWCCPLQPAHAGRTGPVLIRAARCRSRTASSGARPRGRRLNLS